VYRRQARCPKGLIQAHRGAAFVKASEQHLACARSPSGASCAEIRVIEQQVDRLDEQVDRRLVARDRLFVAEIHRAACGFGQCRYYGIHAAIEGLNQGHALAAARFSLALGRSQSPQRKLNVADASPAQICRHAKRGLAQSGLPCHACTYRQLRVHGWP
jgi:hypothetical protein